MQMMDTECYGNYWLCKFMDRETGVFESFPMSAYHPPLDLPRLRARLLSDTTITFNGEGYDFPVIECALAGFTCEQLKIVSDYIIMGNSKPWDVRDKFGAPRLFGVDHIDLFNVTPGQASLKIYGGRAHSKKMQDLPFEPSKILTYQDMVDIDLYCGNDLVLTNDVYTAVEDDISTRIDLTAQYGVDMRSKSDAQIAEAAFKKLLGLDYSACEAMKRAAYLPGGTQFYYKPPAFLKFTTPACRAVLDMFMREPFTMSPKGQPQESQVIKDHVLTIKGTSYQFGAGGLHSKEFSIRHVACAVYSLQDVDAESFYPKIISILRMYPHQIGPVFLTIYDGWIEVRLDYKHAGEVKKAATFKIKINGSFGKLGSQYSILCAPQLLIQTTVTGQLCLLMLSEMLNAIDGISVVSANTDGVVIKCRRDLEPVRDAVVARWRFMTGFKTEANDYRALFSRDVNSYIAFKVKGKPKTKGDFAIGGLAKNPEREICTTAVIAYIENGTPLEKTIRECSDIRRFVTVRAVKGGGEWVHETIQTDTMAQKRALLTSHGWFEMVRGTWVRVTNDTQTALPTLDAIKTVLSQQSRTYLGKAVRWYYGHGQTGHIAYTTSGNRVARSEGCKPCMELPDVLPPDIDYDWYINEANELLASIGCC